MVRTCCRLSQNNVDEDFPTEMSWARYTESSFHMGHRASSMGRFASTAIIELAQQGTQRSAVRVVFKSARASMTFARPSEGIHERFGCSAQAMLQRRAAIALTR